MKYRFLPTAKNARLLPLWGGLLLLLHSASTADEFTLTPPQGPIEKYGKAEFRIDLDREYAHPFDPSEVDLILLIEAPSKNRIAVPVFFFQPCERKTIDQPRGAQDWIYPTGEPRWMARFTPEECGIHHAVARLTDHRGTVHSNRVSFESADSENPGFLRNSSEAPRYLAFDNGAPFFAIGQNLAFIGPSQSMTPSRTREAFKKLAENGANFVRIWTGCHDWALAIESPRSAWRRSWTQSTPIADLPGREGTKAVRFGGPAEDRVTAAPYDAIPVRPDTEYVLTGKVLFDGAAGLRITVGRSDEGLVVGRSSDGGEQSFEHAFRSRKNEYYLHQITLTRIGDGVVWLADLSLREAASGPELLADADPSRPDRGVYHPIDAFMLDELVQSARENGVYLQLCVTMRDLYMDALKDPTSKEYDAAIRDAESLMRYFVARWGYSTSVAAWEYFNEMDPGRPTDRFYAELGEYLDRIDPYRHPRTTSTWSTSHRDWRHPRLDIAQAHHYLRPSTLEKTPDVVAAVLGQARDLREHSLDRPMLLAEFGLADEKWGLSPRMKEDLRLEHFHNALWASSLSGLSGTAMFWWWEQLDRCDAYHHYRPLAHYLKTVPFAAARLEPDEAEVDGSHKIMVVGLKGSRNACYWLYDPENSWERRGGRETAAGSEVTDAVLRVVDLPQGDYSVDWWDTRNGKIVENEIVSVSNVSLELAVPTFAHDIACQVAPHKRR